MFSMSKQRVSTMNEIQNKDKSLAEKNNGRTKRSMTPRADRRKLLARLKRIEGQVRGLQRMIEEDRYCVDILVQVAAVRAALHGVAMQLLEQHAHHCVQAAIRAGEGDEAIEELLTVVKRMT